MYVRVIILFFWACRIVTTESATFDVGTRLAKRGELPWHALIYLKTSRPYKLICGGTIVRRNAVISVAQCYWDSTRHKVNPESHYAVAAGKVHRLWDDPEDNEYAQKSDVKSIHITSRYHDKESYYNEDISVILLSKPFEYNLYISLALLHFEDTLDRVQIDSGTTAKIPTWRHSAAQALKVMMIQIMSSDECLATVERNFQPFITHDKICATSRENDTLHCQGDTGSGLVIREIERGETHYHLRGVYSVDMRSSVMEGNECGDILGYTNVIQHKDFLNKYLNPESNLELMTIGNRSDQCQMPAHTPNGRYQMLTEMSIEIICDPGYGVADGETKRFCSSRTWVPSGKLPKCVPFCKLNRDPSIQYDCIYSGKRGERACNDYEAPGIIAVPKCVKPDYISYEILPSIVCNTEGLWSHNPRCLPACKRQKDSRIASRGELPWHVLIYQKDSTPPYMQSCGGSIIKPNTVISAAHCFWDDFNKKTLPASKYAVAAGKVRRPWDDFDDNEYAQKSDVNSIITPNGYRGNLTYTNDLAVLLLSKSFKYNQYIEPVHIDFEIFDNFIGKVPTWGPDSQVLEVVDLFAMDKDKCFKKAQPAFQHFITNDKICTLANGTVLSVGDSGAGLVTQELDASNSRYHLRGVLSVAPEEDSCNSVSAFTHISKHQRFLKEFLPQIPSNTENRIASNKCQLPEYPSNGRYMVLDAPNASPFQVADFWTLNFTCDPGYGILDGVNTRFCYSGKWSPTEMFPQCVPLCNKLDHHVSVQYRCRSIGSTSPDTRECNAYEPPGTTAMPECVKPMYFNLDELSPITCNDNGKWSDNPKCSPACGEVTPGGIMLIRNGEYVKLGELPWHVGIYSKTTTPYRQICGGSIVRPSVVLSAAHCFWDINQQDEELKRRLASTRNYAVAAGKLYRPWNDPMDRKYEQKADVISIIIADKFHGLAGNYMHDLAVVRLAKSFEYKEHIAPVCLNFEQNFDRQQTSKGVMAKVAGWGRTSPSASDGASPILKVVDLPIVPYQDCFNWVPVSFQRLITDDKICAGYKDKSTAVCEGDSGGGLVVAVNDRGVTRYYLRGIVSVSPTEQQACIGNEIAAFTHVLAHSKFIKGYL